MEIPARSCWLVAKNAGVSLPLNPRARQDNNNSTSITPCSMVKSRRDLHASRVLLIAIGLLVFPLVSLGSSPSLSR